MDQLGNWGPNKLKGQRRVAVSVNICDTKVLLLQVIDNKTDGEEGVSRQLMYCSEGVMDIYLSQDCSVKLGIVDPDFPRIGGGRRRQKHTTATMAVPGWAPVRSPVIHRSLVRRRLLEGSGMFR